MIIKRGAPIEQNRRSDGDLLQEIVRVTYFWREVHCRGTGYNADSELLQCSLQGLIDEASSRANAGSLECRAFLKKADEVVTAGHGKERTESGFINNAPAIARIRRDGRGHTGHVEESVPPRAGLPFRNCEPNGCII